MNRTSVTERAMRLLLSLCLLSIHFSVAFAEPSTGSSCTASTLNRNAPLNPDYSYTLLNVPAEQGLLKVRVTCSDGTVGQTGFMAPVANGATFIGDIQWGVLDPVPLALKLDAPTDHLTQTGQTLQLTATAINPDGTERDISAGSSGTFYATSNDQLATVSEDGLVTVTPLFSTSSSAQVVLTATNEGLSTNYVITLGPKGSLHGTVLRADGITPVAGAEVTVQRNQPLQQVGTFVTDSSGNYTVPDIAGGQFTLSVIEPATGDRGRGFGTIASDGDDNQVDIRLNGQGNVTVQVVDGNGTAVSGLPITISSLTMFRDTRTINGDDNGAALFSGFPAGDLTVSTRQESTNLLGTALATLGVNGNITVTLKLQPIGTIQGIVYAYDGVTPQSGIQVRLLSQAKGLLTQMVTGEDGTFAFDSLPISDGPYTLDGVFNGRLRARAQGLVLSSGGQVLTQNLTLTPVGTVTGQVLMPNGSPAAGATVVVQSLSGLRSTFNAVTSSNGIYQVDGVPQGNFAVVANANGATATSNGSVVSDGQVVTVNIQLQANGLIGVVYDRDGETPVGAGVTVTLNPGNYSTTTDESGNFGFTAVTPNNYTLEAADSQGNRGRTQLVVTTVDTSKALVANITYLGRGQVSGTVRDANGNVQPGLSVTLSSQSIFGGTATGTTDSTGHYAFTGVFVGDFTVSAQNPATHLAGVAKGTLLGDNESVTADVTLRATGSVVGHAVAVDGTILSGARVDIRINGSVFASTTSDADGAYRFDLVPLGDFSILVTNLSTGDKGLTNSTLSTLNEVRTADVHMLGLGQVIVNVIDSNGQPVSNAKVYLNSSSLFGGSFNTTTGSSGTVTFGSVFSGDFTVSASKPAQVGTISGSSAGTVIPGQSVNATITLTSRPVGRIAGIVYAPDAITPLSGITLQLSPLGRQLVSGVDGSYSFNDLEGGTSFTVSALVNGRVRARSGNLQITTNDETVVQNLTLIGIGSVHGVVSDTNGNGVGGIIVRLTNPDPVLGGTFSTSTQSNGSYNFGQIPAGNFSVTATNASGNLRAEGSGRVGFDGDSVTLDLVLVDNAITMPRTLYDANNMRFDIRGTGTIGNGTNSAFTGNGSTDTQAMRLDIVSNGTPLPFANGDGTVGSIGLFGQQITVDEVNALGLRVTRRVYVPKNGYFARYLEIIENPTSAPLTVDISITTNISGSNSNARVIDSSNGDDVLSVSGATNPDRWVIVDDQTDADPMASSSIPAMAFVFDGLGGYEHAASAGLSLVGQVGKLNYSWESVTIPAGASVAYMHFAVQQTNRSSAHIAAERLAQLPPESLEGMTPVELSMVRNFAVPLDGISTVEALPSIEVAEIQGQVLSGDSTTPISGASLNFQSQHPLFGHHATITADAQGHFSIKAKVTGDGSSLAVPLAPFTLVATHPQTGETTPVSTINFAAAETLLNHDLVFINTGNLRGSVTRHTGALVSSGTVRLYTSNNRLVTATIDGNGNYSFTGLHQSDYDLEANVNHPQGSPLVGHARVSVVAGQTTIGDIVMDPTGAIDGSVRTFSGDPVVNAVVRLDYSYRTTTTDTAGRFYFSDVSLGNHVVTTVEPRTNSEIHETTSVQTDTTSTVDLVHPGVGTVSVQVNYARGTGAANAAVRVNNYVKATDSNGRVSFTELVGTYTVTATHPYNSHLVSTSSTTLNNDAETVNATVTLPVAGTVTGTILRSDGVTRASGITVSLLSYNPLQGGATMSATTDAQGIYRINGVPEGSFYIKAFDSSNATFIDASNSIATDGQELTLNLTLANNTIQLPTSLYDANNFLSDIQQNGAILLGTNSVFNAGTMPRRGAGLLQISDANGTYAFVGNNSTTLSSLGRQLTISQSALIAGLHVSRKIYVPSNGYFTRYLEILENPGSEPITVDIQSDSRYSTSTLVQTSNGDLTLNTGDAPDYWAILDDSTDNDPFITSSRPSTAHVFAAPGAAHQPDVLDFRLEGDGARTMTYRFNGITVPSGGKVVVMHFVVQQVNRAGATAASQRLISLPPESLDALQPDEITAIINMPVPADGQSSVAPLPSLYGAISGRVLEGDASTGVPNAYVRIRSNNPLYNRTWQYYGGYQESSCGQNYVNSLISNSSANYSLVGRLINSGRSIPLPVDSTVTVQVVPDGCYTTSRGHPKTGVQSPVYNVDFQEGGTTIAQDIIFPTGILTGTVVGPADYSVTSGTVSIPAMNGIQAGSVSIRSDGTYTYPGLAEGVYTLNATVYHNQGTALTGSRSDAQVTAGYVTVTDIPLQSTGAISGAVVTANGEMSVNSQIKIKLGSFTRTTTSDSLGRYAFTAVPVGTYVMTAYDSLSGATTTIDAVNVTANQTTTQNITLLGLGSIQLQVNFARGTGAFDAPVYLLAQAVGTSYKLVGRTDQTGHLTIANVPIGNYTLRVKHPTVTGLESTLSGAIVANGESQQQSISLQAVASIDLTVLDQDNGDVPLPGATVTLTDQFNTNRLIGTTNSAGQLTVPNIAQGNFTIAVAYSATGAGGGLVGSISSADDGQLLSRTVAITSDRSITGVIDYPGERDLYTVRANAGDVLSVRINGTAVDTAPSIYMTRAWIYNPYNSQLARGYGYDASNNNYQYNEYGNLTSTYASYTGDYTIVVSPYSSTVTGGYRLSVNINGIPVNIEPYADGSILTGRLTRADGVTPLANQRLNLTTSYNPVANANAVTDVNGVYIIAGIPVQNYTLRAIDPSDQRTPISVTGTIAAVGQTYTRDLVMPAKNTLALTVNNYDGTPVSAGIRVDVADAINTRNLYTNDAGLISATIYGNTITSTAYHPLNTGLTSRLVTSVTTDNDSVSAAISLPGTGTIAGHVYSGGAAISGASVNATYYAPGTSNWQSRYAYTDAAGSYTFINLPIGVDINLRTAHPQNGNIFVTDVAQLSSNGEALTVDLNLPAIGSISGQVTYASGIPVSGLYVTATNTVTRSAISAYTDASGNYLFNALEIGVPITIEARHPQTSLPSSISATLTSGGQVLSGQNLVLQPTGSISGHVLSASGTPITGRYVYAYYVYNDTYGYTTYKYAYSDANGLYRIDNLPAGRDIRLRSNHPTTSVYTERVATITSDGELLSDQDMVYVGAGSIVGQVVTSSGTPVANAYVQTSYIYDFSNNYSTSRYAYTDVNGQYRIDNLPTGQALTVRGYHPSVSNIYAEVTATLTNDGEVLTAQPITLPGLGSMRVSIVDSDGIVPGGVMYVYLQDSIGLDQYRGSIDSRNTSVLIQNVPYGDYVVRVVSANTGNELARSTGTIDSESEVTVALTTSLIKGVIHFADGTAVTTPSVYVSQTDTNLVTHTYYADTYTLNGEYRVHGVASGDFTLTAQDTGSGLMAVATGTLSTASSSSVVDVTLPAAGTVSGTVHDSSGNLLANADVALVSSGLSFTRWTRTDATGAYSVDSVALGNVTIYAYDTNGLVGVASGSLTSADTPLVIDIILPATTQVSGTITAIDGSTPVSNAVVSLQSMVGAGGPRVSYAVSAQADVNGAYSISGIPIGDARVTAWDPLQPQIAGVMTYSLIAGTNTADVALGNAARFNFNLDGDDGYRYDVTCYGSLNDGGKTDRSLNDAYDGTYYLSVNGVSQSCADSGRLEDNMREVVIGPSLVSGVEVTRKIFVPATGGYARYLEIIHNPGTTDIAVPVEITGNLGSDGSTRVVVSPDVTNNTYAVTDQNGYCCDPILGHVFGGTGATLSVSTSRFINGNDNISYKWNVPVAAGQTVAVMHFALQGNMDASANVQSLAQSLVNLTDSHMLDGMTATEKSQVLNYAIH